MPKGRVNGINISYKVEGAGEPLVLIMGFTGTRRGWIFQRPSFRKHFQLVTFDNRGVGGSDKPSGPYTMRAMADDTIGLMDHLGVDKAHILGVSMGGMIAQEVAINHPERVRKLVLGCTFARIDEMGGHSAEYLKALGLGESSSEDDLRSLGIEKVLSAVFSLAFNKRLYRMAVGLLSGLYARLVAGEGVAAQFEAILGHDTADRLHMIQAPTLVITGAGDRLIRPASSEVMADRIPNARLVGFEGGSHAFFVEMRGRFNREVLDFLRAG